MTRSLRGVFVPILLAALCASTPFAATEDAPATDGRPKVGLALAGGGARGAAHVGVLKVLEEIQVPVDFIIGTSMGSIIGGMYASGMSPEVMEKRLLEIDWAGSFDDAPPRKRLPFRRKEENFIPYMKLEFGWGKEGLSYPAGVVAGQKLGFLLHAMTLQVADIQDFDDLPVPFRAVAVDLDSGEIAILDHGDLADAMRASMAFPGVISPAEIDGRHLIDGGVLRNLPIDLAQDMGGDPVLAVDVSSKLEPRKSTNPKLMEVVRRSSNLMAKQNREQQLEAVRDQDILIVPDLTGVTTFGGFEKDKLKQAIDAGEAAARKVIDRLRQYSVPDDVWEAYLARQRRPYLPEIVIDQIEVQGLDLVSPKQVVRRIETQPGDTLSIETLEADLERIYRMGDFEHVGFDIVARGGRTVLQIRCKEKWWGPWYIRVGAAFDVNFRGTGNFTALGYLRRAQINRLAAEWRNLIFIGDRDEISSEFYQPVSYSGTFFVAPRVDFRRDRSTLVIPDVATIVGNATRTFGQIDLGAAFGNVGELRVGYRAGSARVNVEVEDTPTLEDDIGAVQLLARFDRLDNAWFPHRGGAALLDMYVSRDSLGATQEYERLFVKLNKPFPVTDRDTIGLEIEAGTDFDSGMPFYRDFRLGGFLNLTAYDTDELFGSTMAFGKVGWQHRFGGVPTTFGGTTYVGATIETGQVWDDTSEVAFRDLILGASVWAGVDSLLGPIYAGVGFAEGGRYAFYLTLGRSF